MVRKVQDAAYHGAAAGMKKSLEDTMKKIGGILRLMQRPENVQIVLTKKAAAVFGAEVVKQLGLTVMGVKEVAAFVSDCRNNPDVIVMSLAGAYEDLIGSNEELLKSMTDASEKSQMDLQAVTDRLASVEKLLQDLRGAQGQEAQRGAAQLQLAPIRGERIDIPSPPRFTGLDGSPEISLWLKTVGRYLEAKKQPKEKWGKRAFAFLDKIAA